MFHIHHGTQSKIQFGSEALFQKAEFESLSLCSFKAINENLTKCNYSRIDQIIFLTVCEKISYSL